MPNFDDGTACSATPTIAIGDASLLDVVLKSQGSARLKRRVSSRFVFSQITVQEYVSDKDGVKERLLTIPIFGSSSFTELDKIVATYLESEIIDISRPATPYQLPYPIADITVGALVMEGVLPGSLSRLILSTPAIANYSLQKAINDRWAFHQTLSLGRAIGSAKARQIDEAIKLFTRDVEVLCDSGSASRSYNLFGAADMMAPAKAIEFCIDALPYPQNVFVRDKYRFGKVSSDPDTSMAAISRIVGVSRQKAAFLIRQAIIKLKTGPSSRAALRLLREPLAGVARKAALQALRQPLKDAQIESFLRDEPHLRIAVVLAYKRPTDWLLDRP